jgi:cobalt-zinc-cadmium efflux system membrane fusion protein
MRHFSLLLLLALALAAQACSREKAQTPEPPAAKVEGDTVTYPAGAPQLAYLSVEEAQPRRLAVTHLTGRLYLADDATVRVFTPVAGQVTAVKADVGQAVARNGALAEISSPDYGQALADARSADANLTAAQKALGRSKDLLSNGATAEKDVEAAEAAYGAALAEKDRAAARLRLYHGSAEGAGEQAYVLRSPIAGTVVERNINIGQ